MTCIKRKQNKMLYDIKIELDNISKWMRSNKLSLNSSKSDYMIIGDQRQIKVIGTDLSDIALNNETLKIVRKTKYLGLMINETLTRKEQYKAIKRKLKVAYRFRENSKISFRKANLNKFRKPYLKAIFDMAMFSL